MASRISQEFTEVAEVAPGAVAAGVVAAEAPRRLPLLRQLQGLFQLPRR